MVSIREKKGKVISTVLNIRRSMNEILLLLRLTFVHLLLSHAFFDHRVAVNNVGQSSGLKVSLARLLDNIMLSGVSLHGLETVLLGPRCCSAIAVSDGLLPDLLKEFVGGLSDL